MRKITQRNRRDSERRELLAYRATFIHPEQPCIVLTIPKTVQKRWNKKKQEDLQVLATVHVNWFILTIMNKLNTCK